MSIGDRYVVTVRVDSKACPWLGDEVVEVGAIVTEVADSYGCCGEGGIMVEGNVLDCPTEIPAAALEPIEDAFRKAPRPTPQNYN